MLFSNLLHFATLAILARLLAPSDFGLMGMVMIVVRFMQTFADMGLSNAVIQRKHVPEAHLSSFFWLNVSSGVIIFIGLLPIRPLISSYFKRPELSSYLLITSLVFLITPVGQIFRTLLKKQMKFKTLSQIEMAGALVYSLTAIGFALARFGVLSLILGQLIESLFSLTILFALFRNTWLPKKHFAIDDIRSYFRFGAFQMGRRTFNYLSANIDYLLIGRFLGAEALGIYTLAYQLITFPLTKINPLMTQVAFPAFSTIQDDPAAMRKGYCQGLHYIAFAAFPMLTGLCVVAPDFIACVYGAKWLASIPVVQLLCLVGLLKSLNNPNGPVILAKGRADVGFYLNVFLVFLVSTAVSIGVRWGIIGVSAAILLVHLPLLFVGFTILKKLIGLSLREYTEALRLPLICSLAMLFAIIPLQMLLSTLHELPRLIITVLIGAAFYGLSYYFQNKTILLDLRVLLKEG